MILPETSGQLDDGARTDVGSVMNCHLCEFLEYLSIKGYLMIRCIFIGRYAITITREKEHTLGKWVENANKNG